MSDTEHRMDYVALEDTASETDVSIGEIYTGVVFRILPYGVLIGLNNWDRRTFAQEMASGSVGRGRGVGNDVDVLKGSAVTGLLHKNKMGTTVPGDYTVGDMVAVETVAKKDKGLEFRLAEVIDAVSMKTGITGPALDGAGVTIGDAVDGAKAVIEAASDASDSVESDPDTEESNTTADDEEPDDERLGVIPEPFTGEPPGKREPCPICGDLVAVENIRGHIAKHDGYRAKCDECGKPYEDPRGWGSHNFHVHDGDATYTVVEAPETDADTDESDTTADDEEPESEPSDAESDESGGDSRVPCEVCGKFFPEEKIRGHLSTHAEKRVECDDCGQRFDATKYFGSHNFHAHDGDATYTVVDVVESDSDPEEIVTTATDEEPESEPSDAESGESGAERIPVLESYWKWVDLTRYLRQKMRDNDLSKGQVHASPLVGEYLYVSAKKFDAQEDVHATDGIPGLPVYKDEHGEPDWDSEREEISDGEVFIPAGYTVPPAWPDEEPDEQTDTDETEPEPMTDYDNNLPMTDEELLSVLKQVDDETATMLLKRVKEQ